MNKLFRVSVGDWSEDGHSECEMFYVEANYPVNEMRQAYKDTCKKIGLQMNINTDYTGIKGLKPWGNWRYLLCDHADYYICEEAVEILVKHGFKFANVKGERDNNGNLVVQDMEDDGEVFFRELEFDYEGVFELFMWFISYSMPSDFYFTQVKYDGVSEAVPINGWWNSGLNETIGYGVFD